MRSFVKIALFAAVAVNAIKINDDTKVTKPTTEEEVKVGKFAFQKADEADRIKQTNVTTPYVKPKSEKISEAW